MRHVTSLPWASISSPATLIIMSTSWCFWKFSKMTQIKPRGDLNLINQSQTLSLTLWGHIHHKFMLQSHWLLPFPEYKQNTITHKKLCTFANYCKHSLKYLFLCWTVSSYHQLFLLLLSQFWLFCDPMDLPSRKWAAIPFSRGFSRLRDWTHISCLAGRFFNAESAGRPVPSVLQSIGCNRYTQHQICCWADGEESDEGWQRMNYNPCSPGAGISKES